MATFRNGKVEREAVTIVATLIIPPLHDLAAWEIFRPLVDLEERGGGKVSAAGQDQKCHFSKRVHFEL